MSTIESDSDDDFFSTIAAAQLRHLMAAQAFDSDLDLAFHLQIQEAITASLSLTSSSPPPPPPPPPPPQTDELEKTHSDRLAPEISFGEGSSSKGGVKAKPDEVFRVYFKGLVSKERVGDSEEEVALAGIGVAICDSRDGLIFEMKKPLLGNGRSRHGAEVKALIEGLNAAIALDLKRVVFYCDYYPLYQFVIGRWPPKQRKTATLVNQVTLLRNKFLYSAPFLVARNDVKFAFKLAREAIVSQVNGPPQSNCAKNMYEGCVICLEDMDASQIFPVDGCLHRYCVACMKQHVEVKLLHGMVPKCPHEGCNSELKIDSCQKFLTPKLIEMMSQRLKEASIPVTEKVYCPYPKCSALMAKSEVLKYSKKAFVGVEQSGIRKCTKCQGVFCINCKVPWHQNMRCDEYKRNNPCLPSEDAKLKSLADMNLWRQCVKCNHMIELVAGCYHMTCRCGYEFCYTCGAEWKNKKGTCSCPLWDEDNILYNEDEEISDEEYEYDDFFDTDSDDVYCISLSTLYIDLNRNRPL
ncbi:hypothetical protein HYC85_031815 [Camellia sinensis]|uniref:RBR-type E3 ubiquitin transferase n=1 Tax=Camellia sinensis TaxID=4442 RepID=A0A7J7FRM5_CAMSI|nr:hypothetical protein HYC85_031815 [Camellia sinensis]